MKKYALILFTLFVTAEIQAFDFYRREAERRIAEREIQRREAEINAERERLIQEDAEVMMAIIVGAACVCYSTLNFTYNLIADYKKAFKRIKDGDPIACTGFLGTTACSGILGYCLYKKLSNN